MRLPRRWRLSSLREKPGTARRLHSPRPLAATRRCRPIARSRSAPRRRRSCGSSIAGRPGRSAASAARGRPRPNAPTAPRPASARRRRCRAAARSASRRAQNASLSATKKSYSSSSSAALSSSPSSSHRHGAARIAAISASATRRSPIFLLSLSTKTSRVGVEAAQRAPDARVELLLRRLLAAGDEAEHRAAVIGERFQVEDLRSLRGEGAEQPALARARRPADDAPAKSRRQLGELGDDGAAEIAVAAVEDMDAKADLIEHRRERAAALAAAPAVDERRPLARLVEHVPLDVAGDVARHQRRAALLRVERRHLRVLGADRHPLGVVERGPVDRAGQPILGELARRACVDDGVEAAQVGDRVGGSDPNQRQRKGAARTNGDGKGAAMPLPAGRRAAPRPAAPPRGAASEASVGASFTQWRRAFRFRSAAASCSAAAPGRRSGRCPRRARRAS